MQGEIGVLLICRELHLVVVVAVLCHGCSCYPTWDEKTKEKSCYYFAFPSQIDLTRLNSTRVAEILNLKTETACRDRVYTILAMNLLVSRRNLLIISDSLYFFRLFTISLPAVLSTHLSLSFPACPSVSPPVSLITVQIINSLLCLVRQQIHRIPNTWN